MKLKTKNGYFQKVIEYDRLEGVGIMKKKERWGKCFEYKLTKTLDYYFFPINLRIFWYSKNSGNKTLIISLNASFKITFILYLKIAFIYMTFFCICFCFSNCNFCHAKVLYAQPTNINGYIPSLILLYTLPMNINRYVPFLINMSDRGWKYTK